MNRKEQFPLLLTSAVRPSGNFSAEIDHKTRLEAYLESIRNWLALDMNLRIVVCDGSEFDFAPYLKDLETRYPIECLKFENDRNGVIKKGKGYGEGQIINYALNNSTYLRDSSVFVKCTGKLWVKNYEILKRKFKGPIQIAPLVKVPKKFEDVKTVALDTRFYIVEKNYYDLQLRNAYLRVNDDRGVFLEHVFLEQVKSSTTDFIELRPRPEPIILGVSGTSGYRYKQDMYLLRKAKSLIRTLILFIEKLIF